MGPGRHIMSYSIAGGKSFNMVLSYYDRTDPSSWTQDTALEDMRQQYAGWDPKSVARQHLSCSSHNVD